MKAKFVENERARPLVTIREDDPIWKGQTTFSIIPEGALVRVFIPADATHTEQALAQISKNAAAIARHNMPKITEVKRHKLQAPSGSVRDIIKTMVNDADLFPLIEEALAKVAL